MTTATTTPTSKPRSVHQGILVDRFWREQKHCQRKERNDRRHDKNEKRQATLSGGPHGQAEYCQGEHKEGASNGHERDKRRRGAALYLRDRLKFSKLVYHGREDG
jgi:hypothetical protein